LSKLYDSYLRLGHAEAFKFYLFEDQAQQSQTPNSKPRKRAAQLLKMSKSHKKIRSVLSPVNSLTEFLYSPSVNTRAYSPVSVFKFSATQNQSGFRIGGILHKHSRRSEQLEFRITRMHCYLVITLVTYLEYRRYKLAGKCSTGSNQSFQFCL
jgi:hypothetical protein